MSATIQAKLAVLFNTTEKNAAIRAMKLRLTPACARCGGSGSYSYNQISGSRCFGCNGHGVETPSERHAEAILEAAEVAIKDGRHDAYLKVLQIRQEAKKTSARIFAAWHASAAAIGNPSHMKKNADCSARELACRQANARIAKTHGEAQNLDPSWKKNATDNDFLAWKTAIDAIFATIDETNVALT